MSELIALCNALNQVIQPLPALTDELQRRAARLKSLAVEVQIAASEVPDRPDCSRVTAGLYEAAHGLEASANALSAAVQQGHSYIQRTVTGGGGGSASTRDLAGGGDTTSDGSSIHEADAPGQDQRPDAPEGRESREDKAVESLREVEQLRPEVWETLDAQERLDCLQDAEDRLAKLDSREPAAVVAYDADVGDFGYHDARYNEIGVGAWQLERDHPAEAVNTIAHEGSHAYQRWCVGHPGTHHDREEVERWRENFGHYVPPERGQEEYERQPVEAYAWRYGDDVERKMYGRE